MSEIEAKEKIGYPEFYACVSRYYESVMQSSSGGVFYEISKYAISNGWIVYGAEQIEPLKVQHIRVTEIEDLDKLRKSKYIRSNLAGVYEDIKKDLDSGFHVLFSGVACQIGGLYSFLKNDYNFLFTCEVVCHGMPLKKSWEKYIEEQESSLGAQINSLVFRDKREGWKNNCISELYSNGEEVITLSELHPVHSLYLQGINIEWGCGKCRYQKIPRIADVSLADYWQANEKEYKDYLKSGVSLVSVNTTKGTEIISAVKTSMVINPVEWNSAKNSCRHLFNAPYIHPSRYAFEKFIKNLSFTELTDLFQEVGEVVLPENLHVMNCENAQDVIDVFIQDTQEIVYFEKEEGVLYGITTFGDFVKKYSNGEEWINKTFTSTRYDKACLGKINDIFNQYPRINRIPIIDSEGRLFFEVRRYKDANGKTDPRKILLAAAELRHSGMRYMFVHRPDKINSFRYTLRQQIRMKNNISFPVLLQNPAEYKKELSDLFGEREDIDLYVEELGNIPPIVCMEGKYQHSDSLGKYVNVLGGKRVTCSPLEKSEFRVHMYGRCGVFGYAVSDTETLPSYLQRYFNKNGIKAEVINHGLWGAADDLILSNFFTDLRSDEVVGNDTIIFYMMMPVIGEEFKDLIEPFIDTTEAFHAQLKTGNNFYDRPGHMNAAGYKCIAMEIFNRFLASRTNNVCSKNLLNTTSAKKRIPAQIANYVEKTKERLPEKFINETDVVGAIVMNCNPFTKGHRYLIEQAIKKVDKLLIFVVEEDKSIFAFKDRFAMIKAGTEDLDTVCVLPGGQFMISTITFPEYFTKEENTEVTIMPAQDVEIFGRYISKAFNISYRFVGTEPLDKVTNQYNQAMKKLLPDYGVDLVEIQRLKCGDSYVSATEARRLLETDDKSKLTDLLPQSSLDYLKR